MTPATEAVLRNLRLHIEADSGTGLVLLGGFDHIPAGKDWIVERTNGKTFVLLGLDPVQYEQTSEGRPEDTRWSNTMSILVTTLYRLREGDDPWGRRFADGKWLSTLLAGWSMSAADPEGVSASELTALGVHVRSAEISELDYSPGDGGDLEAGFVSVQATLNVVAEVPSGETVPGPQAADESGSGGTVVYITQFRMVHGVSADTVPTMTPDEYVLGRFSLYYSYKGLDVAPRYRVRNIEVRVLRQPCDVDMTFTVKIVGIGVGDKTYNVPVLGGASSGLLEPEDTLLLSQYQDVVVTGTADAQPSQAPEGIEVWISTEYIP